ncbi:MAG: DUF1223 domain-containing protein [Rhodospirillales bacterium]|nr:DUF1223 domain-containing protein [Rhodospirillales bacterium]
MIRALKFPSALLAAACVLILVPVSGFSGQPLTVVELFTSQGCSSCPPADKFLNELSTRDDLLALSLHVDYWDYIGWKDPFSDAIFTRRQRDYSSRFNLKYVYTPQMVIQGQAQAVGSNRAEVKDAIREAKSIQQIPIDLGHAGKNITVSIAAAPAKGSAGIMAGEKADVVLVVFDRSHDTVIKRGENSGLKLTNSNVVRSLRKIATWNGGPLTQSLPLAEILAPGGQVCAVLLQSRKTGRILGAAQLALDGN